MSELTTNRLWDNEPKDSGSQYARMILGTSAIPRSRFASTRDVIGSGPVNATDEAASRRPQPRTQTQQSVPQAGVDPFTLCQLVAADLIVLVVVCGALSLFSPAWGLPRSYLPIFAALVALFGFCQRIYKRDGDPSPAGIVQPWQGQLFFAIALVFIATGAECILSSPLRIFASSLAGLALGAPGQADSMETPTPRNGVAQDSHHRRRVLSLVPSPEHCATTRFTAQLFAASSMTICLSPKRYWGESRTWTGWPAPNSSMRSSSLSLAGRTRRAKRPRPRFATIWTFVPYPICLPAHGQSAGIDRIGEVPVVTLHREPSPSAALVFQAHARCCRRGLRSGVGESPHGDGGAADLAGLARPVIYSAERTGAKGRRFRCYKFRSMVT